MILDKMPEARAPGGARLGAWFGVCAFAAALVMPAAPASASILITIDKSAQQMSVAVGGAEHYVWPVSTGRPGYDTPSGTFKPNRMDADHYSQEWDNAPMPHAIFFDLDGHAIHGFFDVKHLGRAVSHGCVRLSPEHAQTLFNMVKAQGMSETKVVVAGHTPGGDNAPVARSHLPVNETAYGHEPSPTAQGSYAPPSYGQPSYAQPGGYTQPGYGQPSYAQRSYAPPYGQSSYGQPYYTRPSYNYAPSGYGPAYAPPGYWQR